MAPLPPRPLWPYALPYAPKVHEWRWRRLVGSAEILSPEEHAARVGLEEIEEPMGCSLCGARRLQTLFETGARQRGVTGDWSYHVVRCADCGLLFRHPGIRPERLSELYAEDYSSFLTGSYAWRRKRRYKLVTKAFRPLFSDGHGRRLLDFGCGAGQFLRVAYRRGFETYGVDLSPDSIEAARRRPSGANAYVGAPEDVPEIAAGGFDVITMWSVLAHLPDPLGDVSKLRGLLADDGVLFILTVNANSLELKAHRAAWNGFTKNHLKFFAPTTLKDLLGRAGFAAVAMRPAWGDTVEAGTTSLTPKQEERLRATIRRGNRGNMLRAVAFADPDGPARWGQARRAKSLAG